MFALGLQGSPRKKGNSDLLLAMFLDALHQRGADTHTLQVARRHYLQARTVSRRLASRSERTPVE